MNAAFSSCAAIFTLSGAPCSTAPTFALIITGASLDNFEWAEGYAQRFGLTYVDFRTRKRTIKDSGHWYAKLASTGSLT